MEVPCTKDKCLKYPICLNKTELECSDLADFYGMGTDHDYDSGAEIWDAIQVALPKLLEIQGPLLIKDQLTYRSFNIYKYPDPGYFNPGGVLS